MKLDDSALRLLVKSYANELLEREQYLKIRKHLLHKLSIDGHIDQKDLQNFMKIYHDTESNNNQSKYSTSEWVIIVLGILAAAALALILFG